MIITVICYKLLNKFTVCVTVSTNLFIYHDIYSFHFVQVTNYSHVLLYCGCELKHINTFQIQSCGTCSKSEHSYGNLECLNKLLALIAIQDTDVTLRYCVFMRYCVFLSDD